MHRSLDVFTVSFFGHRQINNLFSIEEKLENLLKTILTQHEYVEFLVGREGDFDIFVASLVKRLKRDFRDNNSALVWVMPYKTAEYKNNAKYYEDYYDNIEICAEAENAYFKSSYQIRNRQMADRSNLIIFFVEHKSGGAYKTLRYAEKQEKKIINIA